MNKEQFLLGAKFRHKNFTTHVYQYSPGYHVGIGYIWQTNSAETIPRHCLAVCDEITDESAIASFVALGVYTRIEIKYSDFELCENKVA